MKNTYSTNINLPQIDFALLFFRVGVGVLMLVHGISKLKMLFGSDEIAFADPFDFGPEASLALAVLAEFICSILIIIGLGTKLAVIPLIVTMAVAAFMIHAADGWGRQELPVFYLLSYLFLFYTGSGKFSLDHYLLKKRK